MCGLTGWSHTHILPCTNRALAPLLRRIYETGSYSIILPMTSIILVVIVWLSSLMVGGGVKPNRERVMMVDGKAKMAAAQFGCNLVICTDSRPSRTCGAGLSGRLLLLSDWRMHSSTKIEGTARP